jgi:hypothetical protein
MAEIERGQGQQCLEEKEKERLMATGEILTTTFVFVFLNVKWRDLAWAV